MSIDERVKLAKNYIVIISDEPINICQLNASCGDIHIHRGEITFHMPGVKLESAKDENGNSTIISKDIWPENEG